jgi:hypothetical protein
LLEQLILPGRQGARDALRSAGNVFTAEEVSKLGQLLCVCQLAKKTPQMNNPVDVVVRRQRWTLGLQHGQPTEDVWISAQLSESEYVGVLAFEIDQEVPRHAAVWASRVWDHAHGE